MHSEYIKICEDGDSAVLFIHGILSTPRYFDRFLSVVPENWSVYNILLDGHGKTAKDFSNTSMMRWKQQTAERMTELCARYNNVVVVAHSLGTLLTIGEAPKHPNIRGLLLLDAPLKVWVKPAMMLLSLKAAFGKLNKNDPWEQALADMVGVELTPCLWRYLGWGPRFWELLCLCRQTRKKIGKLGCPCYVFHSRQDELVSIKSARYFRGHPTVTHQVLEGSGHNYISPDDRETILASMKQLLQ